MSNIVNLNGRPVSSETPAGESSNTKPKGPQLLTRQEVVQLGGALQRLEELASYEVKTAAHEAEIRGLHEYLANTFLNHAKEFLGAWFTLRNEYEPLLSVFGTVALRVSNIIAATRANAESAQAKAELDVAK